MTDPEAKYILKFFETYRPIREVISFLDGRIQELQLSLEELGTPKSPSLTEKFHFESPVEISTRMNEIISEQLEAEKKKQKFLKDMKWIESSIEKFPEFERKVLTDRFINGMSLNALADKYCYAESSMRYKLLNDVKKFL